VLNRPVFVASDTELPAPYLIARGMDFFFCPENPFSAFAHTHLQSPKEIVAIEYHLLVIALALVVISKVSGHSRWTRIYKYQVDNRAAAAQVTQ
jgi:hypothetical protein